MNRASIESLYTTYGSLVLRRARAILQDEQAAQDAMQEVFLRALRAGRKFREDASPTTWLYRITTNYCLNVRRDQARRSELLRERAPPPSQAQSPLLDERQTVLQVLDRVPEEIGAIAIFYYVDEMNQQEIATLLGVSRRYVRERLEMFRNIAQRVVGDQAKVPM